jgi:hypothetical protein
MNLQFSVPSETERFDERYACWLAALRRRQQRRTLGVHAVSSIEPDAFYRDYYQQNRPLHFSSIGAEPHISFEVLRARYGTEQVEVMRRRGDGDFVAARDRVAMTLAAFIDEIHEVETDALYMTSQNGAVHGALGGVLDEFRPLPGILSPRAGSIRGYLWMGPKGATSRLHYDRANVLIVQIIGEKRVVLVPPHEECFLYQDAQTLTSPVDPRNADMRCFPLFRFATPREVTLKSGSALFIPVGWWHFVESLSPTFSASMFNFRAPNGFAA